MASFKPHIIILNPHINHRESRTWLATGGGQNHNQITSAASSLPCIALSPLLQCYSALYLISVQQCALLPVLHCIVSYFSATVRCSVIRLAASLIPIWAQTCYHAGRHGASARCHFHSAQMHRFSLSPKA